MRSTRSLGILVVGILGFLTLWAGGASARDLVGSLEPASRQFEEFEVAGKVVYFHQRSIDGVAIEGDFINYQFDAATGTLLARKAHWRDDLAEHLPAVTVTREAAEAIAAAAAGAGGVGEIQSARLVLISPESAVLPIRPVPSNPCWVVRSRAGAAIEITVIDAVTGEFLGKGVPPPYTAFSFTGPIDCPATWGWDSWYANAASWFTTMGYSTQGVAYPTLEQIRGHVKSDQTTMFYEIAHGGYSSFNYGCQDGSWLGLASFKIGTWIASYAKMPFTFLASCDGMCQTGAGTFSYEFRKGSSDDAATIGYCGMSGTPCEACWSWSIDWQNALFSYMNQGLTVGAAFDEANADYPTCAVNTCMRFAGDPGFKVMPLVARDPLPPAATLVSPNGGEALEYGAQCEIRWVASDNARVTSVTLLLSTDGGASFPDTVAAGEPNDSSYLWTVPDVTSRTARIKVVAFDGVPNQGSDVSDADFTLVGTMAGVASGGGASDLSGVPSAVTLVLRDGNPVTAGSRIVYGVPSPMRVRIAVYDVSGRMLHKLMETQVPAGYGSVGWSTLAGDGRRLGPGIYFVRLDAGAEARAVKVIVAK